MTINYIRKKSKAIANEFKRFISRGNAVEMAVGIIVGGAFSKVVSSFVDDLIMPIIGFLINGIDLTDFSFAFADASGKTTVEFRYGSFLNNFLDFFIIGIAIFALVKIMNKIAHVSESKAPTKTCPACCMSIPKAAIKCGHCTVDISQKEAAPKSSRHSPLPAYPS